MLQTREVDWDKAQWISLRLLRRLPAVRLRGARLRDLGTRGGVLMMRYIVNYKNFEIERKAEGKPFRIRVKGEAAFLPGEFWEFTIARDEVDFLTTGINHNSRAADLLKRV